MTSRASVMLAMIENQTCARDRTMGHRTIRTTYCRRSEAKKVPPGVEATIAWPCKEGILHSPVYASTWSFMSTTEIIEDAAVLQSQYIVVSADSFIPHVLRSMVVISLVVRGEVLKQGNGAMNAPPPEWSVLGVVFLH